MTRYRLSISLILSVLLWHIPVSADPRFNDVVASSATVPTSSLFELTFTLDAKYDNPYDPDQIDVGADFTGPDGRTMRVNGFWQQGYTRTKAEDGNEVLTPSGAPTWKIRFAPTQPGVWRYSVSARDSTGVAQLPAGTLTAIPSAKPGIIGVSKRNPRAFAFPGEKPYFAVGENLCWSPDKERTYTYDNWIPKLRKAGANWIRLWSWPAYYGLEWSEKGRLGNSDYRGLGVYNQPNAWRLDKILDVASENDIYVMLTIGWHGELLTREEYGQGSWDGNPYNAANGGPCQRPADFWTDPTARKMYRQKLRYIAARYGWRPNLEAWEFWNEVDAPAAWVSEMAQFVKGTGKYLGHPADPFAHLLSTTYGNPEVWRIPEIDFTQTHMYGRGELADLTPSIVRDAREHLQYGKPHLLAEFGAGSPKSEVAYDPSGKAVNLHSGLWSAAAAGDAGTAMIWYWDSYTDPMNVYSQFAPIARAAALVPWTAGEWQVANVDAPTFGKNDGTPQNCAIFARDGWETSSAKEFHVVPGDAGYPRFLFGPIKQERRQPFTFHVDFAAPGRFAVHVNQVSNASRLQFTLDGKAAAAFDFDAAPPRDKAVPPRYQTTAFMPQWNIYQATFDTDCGIDVPAGKHDIVLDNTAGDWLTISEYKLDNIRAVPARVYGMTHDRNAFLWLHNPADTWKAALEGTTISPLHSLQTRVHGLPDGVYNVALIDTATGKTTSVKRESSSSKNGVPVRVGELKTDVAVWITPAADK